VTELVGRRPAPERRTRPAIPLAKIGEFRGAALRLTLLRALFGAGCLVLAAFALVAARHDSASTSFSLPNAGSIVVLDASISIQHSAYPRIAGTLEDLAHSSKHAGLVVFSDSAYEALPPTTPSTELASVARFFQALPNGDYPTNPWTINFTSGTRISNGVLLAERMLAGNGIAHGGIVLVSDLATAASDLDQLTNVLIELRRAHTPVVIVPLNAAPSDRNLFGRLLGASVMHEPPSKLATSKHSSSAPHAFPWRIVIPGGGLLVLLALGERGLARLTWRPRTAEAPSR
jgi:hypothetical protein